MSHEVTVGNILLRDNSIIDKDMLITGIAKSNSPSV